MSPERERSCRDYESLLVKKHTGELLLEENQSLKSHLAQCASCAAEERKLARVWQRLDSLPVPEIPTALYEKTRETIVSDLKRNESHFPWIEKIPRTGIWLFLLPVGAGLATTSISYVLVRNMVDLRIHHHHVLIPLFSLWWMLFAGCFFLIVKKEWQKSIPLDVVVTFSISISLLTMLISSLFSGVDLLQWLERLAADEPFHGYFFGSAMHFVFGWACSVCLASFSGSFVIGLDNGLSLLKKVFLASLFISVLLFPAIYLHGASYGHGLDIVAFGVLGNLLGSLIGASLGATVRRHILAAAT